MQGALRRNWMGLLAILLAVMSIASYLGAVLWSAYVSSHPNASAGKGDALVIGIGPPTAIASLVVGIFALRRARRGNGRLTVAIVGVVLGGMLTLAIAVWIVVLLLSPGLGD
jgi:hypothetical protein